MKRFLRVRKIYFLIGIVCVFVGALCSTKPVFAENYTDYAEDNTESVSENHYEEIHLEISYNQPEILEEDDSNFLHDFVERMYGAVLNRTPDEEGLQYWMEQLSSQSADGATLARGFICSKEFQNRIISNENYLDILYYTFFDREPDEPGKAYWMNQLEKGTPRTEVLSGFVNSKEFGQICDTYNIARGTMEPDGSNIYNAGVRLFVSRLYAEVLERNGDVEGIEYWTYLINKKLITPEDCAKNFFFSQEYICKQVTDEKFVEILYRTFLGRPYDENGKNYWLTLLQSGESREDILSEFANSKEFKKIITQYMDQITNSSIYSYHTANPFMNQMLGDCSFRIPAMVSLNNGTIICAADARWNSKIDGGGTDTVVSISTDYGNTWRQSFANYLGENGNVFHSSSASFLDPALATDGNTIYLLVDFLPSGYAFYGSAFSLPETGVGFDAYGRLLLKGFGEQFYNYYLQDGAIYSNVGSKVEGYSVDGFFNIYGPDVNSNLFYVLDSPFTVYPTEYLYLTKSTDGGQNWSAPKLLNVKQINEQGYSVGCGRGTVLSDGTIIFPCYRTIQGKQTASFIYSNDCGETWNRAPDATGFDHLSSEAAIIELDPTQIRMFYRDGFSVLSYTDYKYINGGWNIAGSGTISGITKTLYCQLSAIKYDENTILISTPASGTEERNSGMVITIKLDSSYGMKVKNYCSVNGNDSFGYSCLTKLSDGSVGLLYESGVTDNKYEILYKRIKAEDLGIY